MTSLEDINDPTKAMNTAFILFAKAFQLSAPTNNNQRTLSNPCNRQIAQPVMNIGQDRQIQNVGGNGRNQFGQMRVFKVVEIKWAGCCSMDCQSEWNCNVVAARAEGTGIGNHAMCRTAED
nr:hypothetical protein [Tanacetum cinerariifolium]